MSRLLGMPDVFIAAIALPIELETQDDLGYYEYGFDIFPRRGAKST
jgi:hypothetical protein